MEIENPCKDCLTFSMCLSEFKSSGIFSRLTVKCKILKNFIVYSSYPGITVYNTDKIDFINSYFKEEMNKKR